MDDKEKIDQLMETYKFLDERINNLIKTQDENKKEWIAILELFDKKVTLLDKNQGRLIDSTEELLDKCRTTHPFDQ